jgi:hypothetical protein
VAAGLVCHCTARRAIGTARRLSLNRTPELPFAIGGGVSIDAWRRPAMSKSSVTITADGRRAVKD